MGEGTAALPRRRLGRTGLEVAAFGIGGFLGIVDRPGGGWAPREDVAVAGVRRAIELGVDYFDTSPLYARTESERLLGIALKSLAPAERARVRLATKAGTHHLRYRRFDADSIMWSVEQSLTRLFADRVDVLLVHDPATDADMDAVLGPGGAVAALERFKTDGTIGAIGIGVRTHRFLRRAIESDRFDAILTPYDYGPLRASAAPVIELAHWRDVGVINGSPYGAGLLVGLDPDEIARRRPVLSAGDLERSRALWRFARERQVDLGALAMQFSLRDPRVAVTLAGPRTPAEVEANVRHATAPLPPGIWADLGAFLASLPPAAPGGEDIPA